jgi:hypothetical protein
LLRNYKYELEGSWCLRFETSTSCTAHLEIQSLAENKVTFHLQKKKKKKKKKDAKEMQKYVPF